MCLIIILVTIAALLSCNNSENSTEAAKDKNSASDTSNLKPGSERGDADVSGCYMKILQRDTLIIQLDQTKNYVTGKLTFDNYEKDGSIGTVHGTIEENIIKLWYNFASEGMNSVMEVYFKKEGERLLRGIGPVKLRGIPVILLIIQQSNTNKTRPSINFPVKNYRENISKHLHMEVFIIRNYNTL